MEEQITDERVDSNVKFSYSYLRTLIGRPSYLHGSSFREALEEKKNKKNKEQRFYSTRIYNRKKSQGNYCVG